MSLKESLNLRYNPNSRFEYVVAKHVPDDNPFFLVPIESRKNKVKPKKNPFKEYPPSADEESPEEEIPQSERLQFSGFPKRQENQFNVGFREGEPTVTELQDEIARLRDDLNFQRGNQARLQNLEAMNRGLGYELQMLQNENEDLRNRIDDLNRSHGGPSGFPTSEYKRDDGRRKLADDYEKKIAELQRELDAYRFGTAEPGSTPQIQNELNELRAKNKNLEYQLQRAQADVAEADEHRAKLVKAEVDNRSLQTQVDTLKGLLKSKTDEIARIDAEYRGLLNEKVDENNLFQRKIDELSTIKEFSRVLFSVEIERLHNLISEKVAENEALHEHLDKLERLHAEPDQHDREKYEPVNLSGSVIEGSPSKHHELERLNRDLKFKAEEYEAQIEALKKELKAAIQDNVGKDREIVRLKAMVDALQNAEPQRLTTREEIRPFVTASHTDVSDVSRALPDEGLYAKLIDYENKMVLFVIEIERLQQEKIDLADSIEQLKEQAARREKDLNNQIKSLKDYYDSGKNENLEEQLRDSTAKLNAEKSVIEYQFNNVKGRIEELEKREQELQAEVDKYRRESLEKGSEADAWKNKYQFLERRYQNELDDLKGDMDYRIREKVDMEISDLNLKFAQERSALELAVSRLKNRLQDYENRLVLFIFEIERLQNVVGERTHENSRLKELIDGQDQSHDEALDALRREFDNILKRRVENELDAHQGGWQAEKQALEEMLQGEKFRNENLERTIQRQLEELDRLHRGLNKDLDYQLDPRDQARQQEVFHRLRQEVSDYEIKTVMFMIEVERLSTIVQKQSHELEDIYRDMVALAEALEQIAPEVARALPAFERAFSPRRGDYYSPSHVQTGERRAQEPSLRPGERQGITQLDLSKLPAGEERITVEEGEIMIGGPGRIFEGEQLPGQRRPEVMVSHGIEEGEKGHGREDETQGPSTVPLRGSRGSRESLRQRSMDKLAREPSPRTRSDQKLAIPVEDRTHPQPQKGDEGIVRSYILDEDHEHPEEEKLVPKLLSDIAEREKEIEELKKQIDELQNRHQTEKDQLREELQDAINSKTEGDIKALIDKINEQKNALEDENNQLHEKIRKFEEDAQKASEIEPMKETIESLKDSLKEKENAIETLENDNQKLENEKEALKNEIDKIMDQLKSSDQPNEREKEIDRLQNLLGEKDQEFDQLKALNDQAKKERDELEKALQKAEEEAQEAAKSRENDVLILQKEVGDRDEQIQKLAGENEQLKAGNEALGKSLSGDLNALQDELEKRGQEIQRLQAENSNLGKDLERKDSEIQDLADKQKKLEDLLDQKDHAVEELVGSNNALQNDNGQMHRDLVELSQAFAEKENERGQLADENNRLKARVEELEGEVKELSEKLEGLAKENEQNTQGLINELKDREDAIKNLQVNLDQLAGEKEAERQTLQDEIQMKDKIIEDLQKTGDNLTHAAVEEKAKLENDNKNLNQELKNEKAKGDDLANKLKAATQEKDKLEKAIKDKDAELKRLADKNKTLEQDLNRQKKLNEDGAENAKRVRADLDKARDDLQKLRNQAAEDKKQLAEDRRQLAEEKRQLAGDVKQLADEKKQADELSKALTQEKNLYQFRFTLVCAELERLTKLQKQKEEDAKRLQAEAEERRKQDAKRLREQLDAKAKEREQEKKLTEHLRSPIRPETEQPTKRPEIDYKTPDSKLRSPEQDSRKPTEYVSKYTPTSYAKRPTVDYDDIIKKLEEQIKALTLENKQLKDRVNELEGQLKQAQQKSPTNIADLIGNVQQAKDQELLQDLEHARAEFDMKLDEKDREIEELKKQLGELQKENDERKGENDYLKEQLLGVEQHFTDQIKELVGTMEKAKEEEINKLLEDKQKERLLELEHLKERMEEEIRAALENQKAQYEKERGDLVFEIEAKDRELDFLKNQLEAARGTLDPKDFEIRFSAERAALEAQILQLRQKMNELQKTNDELARENNDLRNELKRKIADAQKLKLSSDRGLEFEDLRKQLDHYRRLNREYEENKAKSDAEKAQIQTALQQRNQLIQQNRLEVEKLYELLEARKEENESLAHDLSESRQEATRFMRDFKDIEREYVILKHKYEQLIKELEEMIRMRDMYREQWEQSNQDLTRKNQELVLKIEEVDSLRMKYEEAINASGLKSI